MRYRGVNEDRVAANDQNLVVRAIQSFSRLGPTVISGALIEIENEIPIGVGLGSSAAAIVAGLLVGSELAGRKVERSGLLREAAALEHHPDNSTAALCGGFVVAAISDDDATRGGSAEVFFHRCDVSESLDFIVVTPDRPLPTEKARAALPAQYSRARRGAEFTTRRAADRRISVRAAGSCPNYFAIAFISRIAAPLIPGISDCLEFRHEGLAGVFISGAGSSVMAIATAHASKLASASRKICRQGVGSRATRLKADNLRREIM